MSARKIVLAPRVRLRARRLRKLNHSWESVAKVLGISQSTIRRNIDPDYAENRRTLAKQQREHWRHPCAGIDRRGEHVQIHRPDSRLLADRDARVAVPLTLTQLICGDPPPGYSALDRRGGA